MNQNEIDKKRAALQAELKKLEDEEKYLATLTPDMKLAEALHDLQCHFDHTDQCDWHYDSWPSTRGAYGSRNSYMVRAMKIRTLLPKFTDDEIIEVAQALR